MNNESRHDEIEYRKWLDYGSWIASEALCVFIDRSPKHAKPLYEFRASTQLEYEIRNLINIALREESIEGLKFEGKGFLCYAYAPCINWLQWAMSKETIVHTLPPLLLEAAGLIEIEALTPIDLSPKDLNRHIIIQTVRVLLEVCPYIRLCDIIDIIKRTNPHLKLPSEKTIRNYISEAKVVLSDTRRTDEQVAFIEKILNPKSQTSSI